MAIFQDYAAAQEWEKGIVNQIREANPNWNTMDKAQKQAAAQAWLASRTPEQRAQFQSARSERNALRAQHLQSQQPAPQQAQPPPPPAQPASPAATQQHQAGIRPPAQPGGGLMGGGGRPLPQGGIRPAPEGAGWFRMSSPEAIRAASGARAAENRELAEAEARRRAAGSAATTARWQAAENAAAARQRDPGKPYVAGGSFSADGRTNGEVYDQWRKRGSVSGIRRTL